ncbi:dTDP-4-amino-4,6-dideoxygalactose transaminase [Sphingobacteriales bacterium UPWRP_1]|nr:dTDP-4-amino-4,6-dideoxygalactose transaminase [Sphingobacteriales bacterium TSM_CSM]PSJ74519.1 dTDP-4-amino-4,6-dideoxygalactose transaminase [Sphingobacteriales bacterium UPWRP_1]
MNRQIPFNKPFLTGKETQYIEQAVAAGKISGDGEFSLKCHRFFEKRYGFTKALLTTSCTDALEMCALLINTQPGDEIIMPAYTFVSTANAFVLRGARITFADSEPHTPNIDVAGLEQLITPKTKAIVVVHYAGIACNMDAIMQIANRHGLYVIEDAAHSIDSFYRQQPLGSIGHLAAFSFHETKNVIAGEGGMLSVNDPKFVLRAEILREKGTNRTAFFRGEVSRYEWVDIGSSFLPSELTAAFLYAQLEQIDQIQQKRIALWNRYYEQLTPLETQNFVRLPYLPPWSHRNGHLFFICCPDNQTRNNLIAHLRSMGIYAVFHYLALHKSPYYQNKYTGGNLPMADYYTGCLVRLPLFYELGFDEVDYICEQVTAFFTGHQRG